MALRGLLETSQSIYRDANFLKTYPSPTYESDGCDR